MPVFACRRPEVYVSRGALAHRLPAYVILANKLVRVLKHPRDKTAEEQGEVYRRDLRALYETLRPWFESAPNKT